VSAWSSLRRGVALYRAVKAYLGTPLSLAEAKEVVKRRLAVRQERFLAVARMAVFEYPESPYLALLKQAGCGFGDLAHLVRDQGVEGALRSLAASGVYVTLDEFKGNLPIRKFGQEYAVRPEAFDNPFLTAHYVTGTSATRSRGTPVPISLDTLAEHAADLAITLDAWEVGPAGAALWVPTYPGFGLNNALRFAKAGVRLSRWFTQVDPRQYRLSAKNRLFTRLVYLAGRQTGVPFPRPQIVPLTEAHRIAAWIAEAKRQGMRPAVRTFVSSALRIAEAAQALDMDIAGARLLVGGESLSRRKRQGIAASGAVPIPDYSSTETGPMGMGCLADSQADVVHLFSDRHALITRRRVLPSGESVDSLLVTTLSPHAPKVLLNVEMGDCGQMAPAGCGCPLQEAGFDTLLQDIRSYEKLTSEGMTLPGVDFVEIVEEQFPRLFGGTVADYQIVEEEAPGGLVRLNILIAPRVGAVDQERVTEAFLGELRRRRPKSSIAEIWSQARTVRVTREPPRLTRGGKLLPFLALGAQPIHVGGADPVGAGRRGAGA